VAAVNEHALLRLSSASSPRRPRLHPLPGAAAAARHAPGPSGSPPTSWRCQGGYPPLSGEDLDIVPGLRTGARELNPGPARLPQRPTGPRSPSWGFARTFKCRHVPDGAAAGPGLIWGEVNPAAVPGRGPQLDPARLRAGRGPSCAPTLSSAAVRQRQLHSGIVRDTTGVTLVPGRRRSGSRDARAPPAPREPTGGAEGAAALHGGAASAILYNVDNTASPGPTTRRRHAGSTVGHLLKSSGRAKGRRRARWT